MSVSHLLNTYNQLPIAFVRGEGAYLYDENHHQYLDALGGIAVCALGHCHPEITKVIREQAGQLIHTSNLYHIPHSIALADKLCSMSGMEQVFFSNSGAEANECAIKLARLFGHKKGYAVPKIIVLETSFHGRTLATLSATASKKAHAGYEPLVEGFIRVPVNDIEAVKTVLKTQSDVAAVLFEPIQGEGGIHALSNDYMQALFTLSHEYDFLTIVDEIQTGMGRTGAFFAYMHQGYKPNIVTAAKALGNGIPIAACLVSHPALDLMKPGMHGSTFGGNPFATKVALTVLEILEKNNLIARAGELGELIQTRLREELRDLPAVVDIRGQGLMIGIELNKPCRDILTLGLKHRILFSVTADKVIRLLPPYILTNEQAKEIVGRLVATIRAYCEVTA